MNKTAGADDVLLPCLWRFSRIMYYRFEFARGCPHEKLDWRPGVAQTISGSKVYMPRISARTTFLASKGKATYLDDLMADIEQDADPGGLINDIKDFVETTCCPPTLYEPAHFSPESVPFFPRLEVDDHRLHEYCRQLVELDSFLIESIGVRPGSLLPVWIQSTSEHSSQPPRLSSLVLSTGIVPALSAFIMREHGDNAYASHAKILKPFIKEEVYKGSKKNNPDLLDDALRWGRVGIFTAIEVMESSGTVAMDFLEKPMFFSKEVLRIAKAKLTDMNYGSLFPATLSGHIRREMDREDDIPEEYSRPFKINAENYHSTATPMALANKPSFRRRIERHIALGVRLMMGDYKKLW